LKIVRRRNGVHSKNNRIPGPVLVEIFLLFGAGQTCLAEVPFRYFDNRLCLRNEMAEVCK